MNVLFFWGKMIGWYLAVDQDPQVVLYKAYTTIISPDLLSDPNYPDHAHVFSFIFSHQMAKKVFLINIIVLSVFLLIVNCWLFLFVLSASSSISFTFLHIENRNVVFCRLPPFTLFELIAVANYFLSLLHLMNIKNGLLNGTTNNETLINDNNIVFE